MPQSIRHPQSGSGAVGRLGAQLGLARWILAAAALGALTSCAGPTSNVPSQAALTNEQGLALARQAAAKKAWPDVVSASRRTGAAADAQLV